MRLLKSAIRGTLARFGYVIQSVGRGGSLTGVDMLHDVKVLLGGGSEAILFDVGANIGQTIDNFMKIFRNPIIYSFEPSPATYMRLRRAYGERPSIFLEDVALGVRDGILPFHVTRDYSVNDSLLEPAWDAGAEEVPVRVRTIDRYCEEHGINGIDFLKVDTQGSDLDVLHGAAGMLGERRIRAFCVEIAFVSMYHEQAEFRDLIEFCNNIDYNIIGFYDSFYIKNRLQYVNMLFSC